MCEWRPIPGFSAHKRPSKAARSLGLTLNGLRGICKRLGMVGDQYRLEDVPAQYRPMFDTIRAKVGSDDALRIIRDHLEKRG